MKTRASLSMIAATSLAAAAALTACGDPLMTAEDHGDSLFGVHGQALSADPATPASELEVGVMFLRVVTSHDLSPAKLETEIIPGKITGSFPAQFSVQLTEKPRVYPYDEGIIYITLGGEPMDGVFSPSKAPEGVRIGHLVIGPAAELAGLPATLDYNISEDRTLGKTLAPYLAHTTITSYQVIYAEGVHDGDVIYPKYTEDGGAEGGKPIKNGFTLVDARTYFEATIWQECASHALGGAYQKPAYSACTTANAALINCLSNCHIDATCRTQCYAAHPGQLDSNQCLLQAAEPELTTNCGSLKVPNRDQLQILRPQDALSVTLGADDVKAGLWILHATAAQP